MESSPSKENLCTNLVVSDVFLCDVSHFCRRRCRSYCVSFGFVPILMCSLRRMTSKSDLADVPCRNAMHTLIPMRWWFQFRNLLSKTIFVLFHSLVDYTPLRRKKNQPNGSTKVNKLSRKKAIVEMPVIHRLSSSVQHFPLFWIFFDKFIEMKTSESQQLLQLWFRYVEASFSYNHLLGFNNWIIGFGTLHQWTECNREKTMCGMKCSAMTLVKLLSKHAFKDTNAQVLFGSLAASNIIRKRVTRSAIEKENLIKNPPRRQFPCKLFFLLLGWRLQTRFLMNHSDNFNILIEVLVFRYRKIPLIKTNETMPLSTINFYR